MAKTRPSTSDTTAAARRGETCQDVLEYLNDAAAVGKTYCGNTPIRIGWKQVECQKEE